MNYSDVMLPGLRISYKDFGTTLQLDECTDRDFWMGSYTFRMTCNRDGRIRVPRTNMK
jgi:hypothetical protein